MDHRSMDVYIIAHIIDASIQDSMIEDGPALDGQSPRDRRSLTTSWSVDAHRGAIKINSTRGGDVWRRIHGAKRNMAASNSWRPTRDDEDHDDDEARRLSNNKQTCGVPAAAAPGNCPYQSSFTWTAGRAVVLHTDSIVSDFGSALQSVCRC